ncbi:thioredoxin TrxA [Buchnera aphidicola (Mindarus keteleerifoliae)]|uniref:thioredoxin TrxA n=1 Tax=Buchnera aphidicola TaxID=9 RepID=UPI0031B72D89
MNNSIITNLNDSEFQKKILEEKGICLVDFWAEWCNPCKVLSPILEKIAKEYENKIKVFKINIDENPKTAPKYSIKGIPTLLLFKKGILVATKVGAISKSQLKEFIDTYVN